MKIDIPNKVIHLYPDEFRGDLDIDRRRSAIVYTRPNGQQSIIKIPKEWWDKDGTFKEEGSTRDHTILTRRSAPVSHNESVDLTQIEETEEENDVALNPCPRRDEGNGNHGFQDNQEIIKMSKELQERMKDIECLITESRLGVQREVDLLREDTQREIQTMKQATECSRTFNSGTLFKEIKEFNETKEDSRTEENLKFNHVKKKSKSSKRNGVPNIFGLDEERGEEGLVDYNERYDESQWTESDSIEMGPRPKVSANKVNKKLGKTKATPSTNNFKIKSPKTSPKHNIFNELDQLNELFEQAHRIQEEMDDKEAARRKSEKPKYDFSKGISYVFNQKEMTFTPQYTEEYLQLKKAKEERDRAEQESIDLDRERTRIALEEFRKNPPKPRENDAPDPTLDMVD